MAFTVTANDGAVQTGSRVLTINAITYVADDFDVKQVLLKNTRYSEIGVVNGRKVTLQDLEGTATLQLASGSTAIPTVGMTFTASDYTDMMITEVNRPETSNGEKKVKISFATKIGTPVLA